MLLRFTKKQSKEGARSLASRRNCSFKKNILDKGKLLLKSRGATHYLYIHG